MVRSSKRVLQACVVLPFVVALGCSSSSSKSSGSSSVSETLEIYSWLTSGSEKSALDKLLGIMSTREPSATIINAAQDRSEIAQQELTDRMTKGNPPDSFQVVSGTSLDEWVDKGGFEPIDTYAAQEGWSTVFPAPVIDSVSRNGKMYGVPLNIERNNTLFYNKTLLASNGIAAPTSLDDFYTAADALKAKGLTPLSVSAAAGWTLAYALWEDALLSVAGPDFYVSYLSGKESADSPQVRQAIAAVGRMMTYANADRAQVRWSDAVAKVCKGEAAMLFLPDFVKGEFENQGCGPDKIGYAPMQPKDAPTFAFVSMAWPLPVGAPHRDTALMFLRVVGSKDGQEAFNPTKGSIPARTDADPSKFDDISKQTLADFRAPGEHLVPAVLASTAFSDAVSTALQSFADPASDKSGNEDKLMTAVIQSYSTLR